MKIYTGIGSRETPDDILIVMTKIASKLKEKGFLLRSGGAKGADSAFEAGAGDYKEIWTPNHDLPAWAWDAASGVCLECPLDKMNPHIQKLIVRNMLQVMGKEGKDPASFVILWTKELDSTGPKCGGTRYAARYAKEMGIEIFNLKDVDTLRNICSLLGL